MSFGSATVQDSEGNPLTTGDLQDGQHVTIIGLIDVAGDVAATTITILSSGGEGEGEGEGEGGSPPKPAELTVLFSGDNTAVQKALAAIFTQPTEYLKMGPVDLDDIESLTLNISDITFDFAGSTGVNTGPVTLNVLDGAFDPIAVSVETGDTVRWLWADEGFHTVTSGMAG